VIGQGISASLLDKKLYKKPRKTILEQVPLVPTKTLVIEILFVRPQLDLPLFLEKTPEQDKLIKIPADLPIIVDNTIPIPKPSLGKQPTVKENLGTMDIDIDTLIYLFYSP
jgi:hypothetical protein